MTIEIKTAISWCAGVAFACISGTYVVTENLLNSELEQYKQSEKWQLPKLLSNLNIVSEELSTKLTDNNEFNRLKKFEQQHKAEFLGLQEELKAAQIRLKNIEGASVFLKPSTTVPMGEPGLLLGMSRTMMVSDGVHLRVGEESMMIEIGESKSYASPSINYTFSYKGHDYKKGYEIIIVRSPIKAGMESK